MSSTTVLDALNAQVSSSPMLGQSNAAGSAPVVIATDQTAVPVSGSVSVSNLPASQTVSGSVSVSNFPATQTVSGTVSVNGLPASSNVIGHVVVDTAPTTAVTGTFFQGTQPVSIASMPSTPVTGTFFQATQPVSIASMPSTPVTGTFFQATQPISGTTTDSINTGRTSIMFYAVAAASGTTGTETAISLTKSAGTGATSAANSWVITSGKKFRISHISIATRGNATATVQTTTFNFRINTGGAVTTSSTPIILSARSATPATASAWDRYIIPVEEGFEIAGNGTLQFGVTAASTFTTNAATWDVTIIGYEY